MYVAGLAFQFIKRHCFFLARSICLSLPLYILQFPSEPFAVIVTEELKKYNEDIREATEALHTKTIPRVVGEMEAELRELLGNNSLYHFRLIENVHSSGVNVRYLGTRS